MLLSFGNMADPLHGVSPLPPDLYLHSPLSCSPSPSPSHTPAVNSYLVTPVLTSPCHSIKAASHSCMYHDVLVFTCLYSLTCNDMCTCPLPSPFHSSPTPPLPLHQSWMLQCRGVLTLLFASGSSPCRGRWGRTSSATLRGM